MSLPDLIGLAAMVLTIYVAHKMLEGEEPDE